MRDECVNDELPICQYHTALESDFYSTLTYPYVHFVEFRILLMKSFRKERKKEERNRYDRFTHVKFEEKRPIFSLRFLICQCCGYSTYINVFDGAIAHEPKTKNKKKKTSEKKDDEIRATDNRTHMTIEKSNLDGKILFIFLYLEHRNRSRRISVHLDE